MRREFHVRFCEGPGVRFPRATRLVIMCRRESQAREALRRVDEILTRLRLELPPEKDEDRGARRREGRLRLPRLPFSDRAPALSWALLPVSVAKPPSHERDPCPDS